MDELLDRDIRFIRGVGEARAAQLQKLGITTVRDMLYFFPRSLEDRTLFKPIAQLEDGDAVCVRAAASSPVQEARLRRNMTLYTLVLRDGLFSATAAWFNNPYVKNAFVQGELYDFYGKVRVKFGKKELQNPVYEPAGRNVHTGRVIPLYRLTADLHQKTVQSVARGCLEAVGGAMAEYLPDWLRREYQLCEINFAISSIHFPAVPEDYTVARRRLAFEELLFLQLGLRMIKGRKAQLDGSAFADTGCYKAFEARLPFALTGAQRRALEEIRADLSSRRPMSRLVQGDVGSGKTAVALEAVYIALQNGFQAAFMAPTEILAAQHFQSAKELLPEAGAALLTGGVSRKEKAAVLQGLRDGRVRLVIGTHALLEDNVTFDNLGLVVTDEQHRFGVRHRAALAGKGRSPHVLVMSATPIPRTLALILYGDLDVSVIDELPPGRRKVDTFVVGEEMRTRIYTFVRKQLAEGRQAYVVCPLVEESEGLDLQAATELAGRLREGALRGCNVELLHGRMKPKEKEAVMARFQRGETHVLVSTTVIEVGVNVPNATVMVVENAERFGLSQLHQLRGRVGRGAHQSYCMLFCRSAEAGERLSILAKTGDGFAVSHKDLELRGPGDFLGTRQHGLPDLKIADLFADMQMLKMVQEAAEMLLRDDPAMERPEHARLKKLIFEMFEDKLRLDMLN